MTAPRIPRKHSVGAAGILLSLAVAFGGVCLLAAIAMATGWLK